MPKLRVLSGREVCRILSEHGFEQVRRKGSHIIMQKREPETTTTVPVPDHDELRVGTLVGLSGSPDYRVRSLKRREQNRPATMLPAVVPQGVRHTIIVSDRRP
jgi:predicted RNA binding protein YcfA (HicA-like mRNA interferase family)